MDQYINATHLMASIDAALARPLPRGNAKSMQDLVSRITLSVVKQMVQEELKTGEFRPVVHAHWIEHWEDFGESLYSECSHCHDTTNTDYGNFCNMCGAIMDEPREKAQ